MNVMVSSGLPAPDVYAFL